MGKKLRKVLQHITIKSYKANLQQQKTLTCSLFVSEVHSPILAKNKCLNHLFIEVTSKFFPTLNTASADRRSSDIVLRKNVFILFSVEKHLSGSAVVIVV
jgi:hypothetical protein